jgi:hypothetical protein
MTCFVSNDVTMGGKWLEVLKETASHLTRIMTILHPGAADFPRRYQPARHAARELPPSNSNARCDVRKISCRRNELPAALAEPKAQARA